MAGEQEGKWQSPKMHSLDSPGEPRSLSELMEGSGEQIAEREIEDRVAAIRQQARERYEHDVDAGKIPVGDAASAGMMVLARMVAELQLRVERLEGKPRLHETVEMMDPDTGKTFVAAVPERTYPLRRRADDGGEDWVSYDGGKTWGRPVKP